MGAASIPCGVCPGQIAWGMKVCPGCDRPVTEQDNPVLQVRMEGGDFQAHARGRRMRAGSKWIGALAILFAVAAPLNYALQKTETDEALAEFDHPEQGDDDAATPADGTHAQSATRVMVRQMLLRGLAENLILAALMGLLWLWARRAPLPAIGCALALYLVIQVVSGVWDPSSIYKGIFIKLMALGALSKGLQAALDARAAIGRPSA